MRLSLILVFFTSLILTGCVSRGKYRKAQLESAAAIGNRERVLVRQTDSIADLTQRLAIESGANRALLATQDKYLDRLQAQEDDLDALRGNLSNTSARLQKSLEETRAERDTALARVDTLLDRQRRLTQDFQGGAEDAAAIFRDSLVKYLTDEQFSIETGGGEVILAVQEDVLFQPRSVDKLAENNAVVFRTVMDALQANPLLKLTVIGHTDNKPNPRRGTNNWEYASLRATRIADELASTYYLSPNRVTAASQGEFRPLRSNSTEEGRRNNRRIEFVLRNNVDNFLRGLSKLGK